VWLGTSALDLGAISMFWYCFREKETILDLFEYSTGQRMHTRYFQVGGLAEDIPEGFYAQCHDFVEWMPKAINDYLTLLDRNKIWLERTKGVGLLSAEDAIALGQTGPAGPHPQIGFTTLFSTPERAHASAIIARSPRRRSGMLEVDPGAPF
jgi:NADH-quinone oxidoreductase subunit D